jgi:hypothetical protein
VRLVNERAHLKNWYIEIQASRPELIDRFKQRCYLMPKSVHWFHQGNSNHWQMFEFWTDNQGAILDACLAVASDLNLELQV